MKLAVDLASGIIINGHINDYQHSFMQTRPPVIWTGKTHSGRV